MEESRDEIDGKVADPTLQELLKMGMNRASTTQPPSNVVKAETQPEIPENPEEEQEKQAPIKKKPGRPVGFSPVKKNIFAINQDLSQQRIEATMSKEQFDKLKADLDKINKKLDA